MAIVNVSTNVFSFCEIELVVKVSNTFIAVVAKLKPIFWTTFNYKKDNNKNNKLHGL
jgi:hypothetical protein